MTMQVISMEPNEYSMISRVTSPSLLSFETVRMIKEINTILRRKLQELESKRTVRTTTATPLKWKPKPKKTVVLSPPVKSYSFGSKSPFQKNILKKINSLMESNVEEVHSEIRTLLKQQYSSDNTDDLTFLCKTIVDSSLLHMNYIFSYD